jgi:hypothetical protein
LSIVFSFWLFFKKALFLPKGGMDAEYGESSVNRQTPTRSGRSVDNTPEQLADML